MSYEQLKLAIIRVVEAIDSNEWSTVKIVYQAQPFINKAYTSLPAITQIHTLAIIVTSIPYNLTEKHEMNQYLGKHHI